MTMRLRILAAALVIPAAAFAAGTDPHPGPLAPPSAEPPFDTLLADGLRQGLDGIGRIPLLLPRFLAAWRRDLGPMAGETAAGLIVASLAAGLVAALALYLLLRALARERLGAHHDDFVGRLKVSCLQLVIDLAALGCFGLVARLAIWRLLAPAGVVATLAEAVVATLLAFGAYLAGGHFLLSPRHPDRRLMPLSHAGWHYGMLAVYGFFGPILTQSFPVLRGIEADQGGITGWFFVSASLHNLYTIAWFWIGRKDIAGLVAGHRERSAHQPGLLRRAWAHALPWFYIGVNLLIWAIALVAIGSPAERRWTTPAGLTQILTVLLPILAAGVGSLGRAVGLRIHGGTTEAAKLAGAAAICTLCAGAVWVASVALLVRLWSEYIFEPGSPTAALALRGVIRMGAAIVSGWTVWTLAKTYLDANQPKAQALMPGQDDNDLGHPASRLATALPLVRNLVLGTILAVTALVILASIGLEIGPFLAGFGVVGLAISFGSQALVRDIVSGIFFMADDAFRVGEYIDTGRLKGTVAKITLRSLQLRHQNGQIHNIPFGQIQSTTNYSRDWATIKFLLRLDRDTDLEKARKTIKRVGEEMMTDESFGDELIQPLKMQGIQEITDTAIVIRCKFTCKPFKPTMIQREALKRIHVALGQIGIAFSSHTVTVRDHAPTPAAGAAASIVPVAAAAE